MTSTAPRTSGGTVNGSAPPSDWPHVSLNDCEMFSVESGIWTGKQPPFTRIGVLRNTNFAQGGTLDLSDVALVDVEARSLPRKLLQSGDIIIERSGGGPKQPVGRVAYFEGGTTPFSFSNFTSRLRVLRPQELLPRFVHYFLHHFHEERHTLTLQHNTTGIRNLMFTDYLRTLVPKPPAPEQEAIAGLLAKIQQAVELEDRRIAALKELKAATMAKVFREGLRGEARRTTEIGDLPASWTVGQIGDPKFAHTRSGGTPSRAVTAYFGGGIPWVKSGELVDAEILTTQEMLSPAGLANCNAEIFPKGTLLLAMYGATAGKTGTLGIEAATNQAICSIMPVEGSFDPVFLQHYLIFCRRDLLARRHGGAQPNISQSILQEVAVPVPQIEEQRSASAIFSRIQTRLEESQRRRAGLESLFLSSLAQLMTGQLRVLSLLHPREATNA